LTASILTVTIPSKHSNHRWSGKVHNTQRVAASQWQWEFGTTRYVEWACKIQSDPQFVG